MVFLNQTKDGVVAKFDTSDNKYKCVYYDKDDESKFYAKFNEFGQKRYSYNKDSVDPNSKFYKCRYKYIYPSPEPGDPTSTSNPKYSHCANGIDAISGCDVLYVHEDNSVLKYIYDNWVTSIIFDTLNIVLSIGLAIFGFLLFKGTNGDHTPL